MIGFKANNAINERISKIKQDLEKNKANKNQNRNKNNPQNQDENTHNGALITDATACAQDIAFPTVIDLLNDARKKAEEMIDV